MFHVEKYHRALIISIDKSHSLQEESGPDGGWGGGISALTEH